MWSTAVKRRRSRRPAPPEPHRRLLRRRSVHRYRAANPSTVTVPPTTPLFRGVGRGKGGWCTGEAFAALCGAERR
ncbi:hypothetical protein DAI22_05g161000 [Oryza sativa Japonica Group]|nr:hypothetical protein DAI22_05g161000 [Oryza sativa Japonica Group]